jgi:predicted Abi (CAAX) family protease
MSKPIKETNFQRYQRAEWIHYTHYPLDQPVDLARYRPVAAWTGRLILPPREARDPEGGCDFEVHHADAAHAHLVGQKVRLRFVAERMIRARNWAVTRHVIFNEMADKFVKDGIVLGERVNHWRWVSPLESLAAGHPTDDIIVRLVDPVLVEEDAVETADGRVALLRITVAPVQITGRYKGLVTFVEPVDEVGERWRVRHFDPVSRSFDGMEEVVAVPAPIANENGTYPSTSAEIERSPLNATGWYIYGAPDRAGMFVVQAWTPRAVVRLEPDRVIGGQEAAWQYVRHEVWTKPIVEKKSMVTSVLCHPTSADLGTARAAWQVGDRALLLHVYSGIGGIQREPYARAGLYFGHFSFGIATVIHEPLADELNFEITYQQIYCHNTDGLVAGTLDYSRYQGDRQFGWNGTRPTCDILLKFDELNDPYPIEGHSYSVMDAIQANLDQMAARYRIGDGRGATYVAAANNCAQDSSQAFYAAIVEISELIATARDFDGWAAAHPDQAARLASLQALGRDLRRKLVGGNVRRGDWRHGIENLGLGENAFRSLLRGLGTWRTILPRKTSDTFAKVFLEHGASAWVIGQFQVGGLNTQIEPIVPSTF